jgi:hypothetical protein
MDDRLTTPVISGRFLHAKLGTTLHTEFLCPTKKAKQEQGFIKTSPS